MAGFASYEVAAAIPARGGSKGVPRKNLRPLCGQPLIAWSIKAAQKAKSVGRIIVSTDDPEIADVARKLGAEVPFLRPAELAQDTTPDLPVCLHLLNHLQRIGALPGSVVWLRPTAPLRTSADIDSAVDVLVNTGADSVRSVSSAKAHPYWMKTVNDGFLASFIAGKDDRTHPNRQSLPPVYMLNGAVDVLRTDFVLRHGALWGEKIGAYVMPPERSIDIDTVADFELAETIMRRAGLASPDVRNPTA